MAVIGEWSFHILTLTHLSLSFLSLAQLRSFERLQRCFETFWDAQMWGKGQMRPCSGASSIPRASSPTAAANLWHIRVNSPQEPQSRSWVIRRTDVLPERRVQKSQWLIKAKHKAIRCLQPISSWNFYLKTAGIQELLPLNQLFHLSFLSVFLSLSSSSTNSLLYFLT